MNDNLTYTILSVLLISNGVFLALYLRERKKKLKDKSNSLELSEFIRDLLTGEAVVKITRIDPENLFLRSPRHGR